MIKETQKGIHTYTTDTKETEAQKLVLKDVFIHYMNYCDFYKLNASEKIRDIVADELERHCFCDDDVYDGTYPGDYMNEINEIKEDNSRMISELKASLFTIADAYRQE